MGPDLTATRRASACPSCGASAKADATFCGQCYTDFRPPAVEAPPLAPAQRAAYGVPEHDPLTAPLLDVVLPQPALLEPVTAPSKEAPGWPCTRCKTVNPLESVMCKLCGGGFLATVSQESKVSLKLPLVGDLGAYSRGQRAGLALMVLLALLLPLALVTLLLTKSPPPDAGTTRPTTSTPVVDGSSPAPAP